MDAWTEFVIEGNEGLLSNEVDSWMTGVNQNVEGKQTRISPVTAAPHRLSANGVTGWRMKATRNLTSVRNR